MARELLLFLILFAAGMLILVFVGIFWMTAIWEKIAQKTRENRLALRQKANAIRDSLSQHALSKRGVKSL